MNKIRFAAIAALILPIGSAHAASNAVLKVAKSSGLDIGQTEIDALPEVKAPKAKTAAASSGKIGALLPRLVDIDVMLEQAVFRATAAEPIASSSYRLAPVEKRWDSDPYGYYAILQPVSTMSKAKPMKYYVEAMGALLDSTSALNELSHTVREESGKPAYTPAERSALERAALAFNGQDERIAATQKLADTYRNSARQLANLGDVAEVGIDGPALAKVMQAARSVLEANAKVGGSAVTAVSSIAEDKDLHLVVIPSEASAAREAMAQALDEPKTTFLVLRSSPENEESVAAQVDEAARVTQMNRAEWRVIWIKNENVLPQEMMRAYFGDDAKTFAVSLRFGTGRSRQVVERFELSKKFDAIAKFGAFANAGFEE